MSANTLRYSGTLQWQGVNYENPLIYYCENLMPYGKDLVLIRKDQVFAVECFSDQEGILGVVTLVKNPEEHLAT